MKSNSVIPVFAGYQFTISLIHQYNGSDVKWYGYEIKNHEHHESGGAYETIESATRACLARIETLAFDSKHPALVDISKS